MNEHFPHKIRLYDLWIIDLLETTKNTVRISVGFDSNELGMSLAGF